MSEQRIYKKEQFSLPSRYVVKKTLGAGSYGTVCQVIDTRAAPGKPVQLAVKKVSRIYTKPVLMRRAIREFRLMHFFRGHPNIVSLVDAELVAEGSYAGLYCFQELMEWDLANVIFSPVQFSEYHMRHFMHQILSGIKFFHSADVIHRDLKPGNILVTCSGVLKICDFGLSRAISCVHDSISADPITNYVATRWYRAPELLMRDRWYGKPVDMWAAGCILAEMYGRRPLMPGKDSVHQYHEIVRVLGPPAPEVILRRRWSVPAGGSVGAKKDFSRQLPVASRAGVALIEALLKWDPHDRISVDEALESEFCGKIAVPGSVPSAPGKFICGPEEKEADVGRLGSLLREQVARFQRERR